MGIIINMFKYKEYFIIKKQLKIKKNYNDEMLQIFGLDKNKIGRLADIFNIDNLYL